MDPDFCMSYAAGADVQIPPLVDLKRTIERDSESMTEKYETMWGEDLSGAERSALTEGNMGFDIWVGGVDHAGAAADVESSCSEAEASAASTTAEEDSCSPEDTTNAKQAVRLKTGNHSAVAQAKERVRQKQTDLGDLYREGLELCPHLVAFTAELAERTKAGDVGGAGATVPGTDNVAWIFGVKRPMRCWKKTYEDFPDRFWGNDFSNVADLYRTSVKCLTGAQIAGLCELLMDPIRTQEVMKAATARLEECGGADGVGGSGPEGAKVVAEEASTITADDAPKTTKPPMTVTVERIKNRFFAPAAGGYRDVLVSLRFGGTHVMELQLHLQAVLAVKQSGGHMLYRWSRRFVRESEKYDGPVDERGRPHGKGTLVELDGKVDRGGTLTGVTES